MNSLYAKLSNACKALTPSDQPSPQHATLSFPYCLPIFIEHEAALINFFKRDKYGVSLTQKDEKKAGNHSTQALGQVYVKADDYLFNGRTNPLDFMMEKAVSLLSYHLFPQERLIAYSQIATFNNLHKVKIVEEHDTYLSAIPGLVQISERIEGIRLDEVLKHVPSQGYDAWFRDTFSLSSYQSFVLLSLLIRPADYKADNIMLKKEKDEVYHLVGIDNDMAFADSLGEFHGSTHVGVKNILYALPLMDEPFTEEVIQGIKGWNPALIVIQWLKDLDHYNQHYAPLFEGSFKERYDAIPLWIHAKTSLSEDENEEYNFIYPPRFPLKLREGTALKLYKDLSHIKKVVEKVADRNENQQSLTLHQTFETLDPLLANYYRWLREEYKNTLTHQGAKQAYQYVTGELYKINKEWKTLEELFEQSVINHTLNSQLVHSKDSKAYLKERTQLINEALIQHLDNLELQALTPYDRKQVLEEVFLSMFELASQAQHPQWQSPHLVHEGLKHKDALFSLSLLKTLINKFPESLRMLDEEQGYAPLHYTIQNQAGIPILEFLLKIGADVNQGTALKNGKSFTPLDLSCLKEDIHAFMLLAHNSATSLQNLRAAASFYTTGLPKAHQLGKMEEWKIAYAYLRQKSDDLNWLLTLEEHFPQGWVHNEALPKVPTEIKGAFIGERILTPQMVAVILDQQGKFKKDPTLPGRAETTKYPKENPLFYFKKYPELPACEYAATSFMRRLGMKHVPRSELLIFHDPQEGTYPVLLTEAIQGDPVYKIWDNNDNFKHLDPIHTGLLIIASMLLNPEDQKEDNFILSPDKKYLIPIDNDHVFLPGVIQVKGMLNLKVYPQLQTKSLAFCLDEMNKPLPLSIIQTIISLNIDQFLQQWMQELCDLQGAYQMLPNQAVQLWDQQGVSLRLPLSSLYIDNLYYKFHLLQNLVATNENISPLILLLSLEPYVGKIYQKTFSIKQLPLRFKKVTKDIYTRQNAQGVTLSVANSHQLMKILSISDEELRTQSTSFKIGPERALEQLEHLQKQKSSQKPHILTNLQDKNEKGYFFSIDEEKELIKNWFTSSEIIDRIILPYSLQLKKKYLTSFTFQNKGQHITILDLRGANFDNYAFKALYNSCPNLEYLNISLWSKLTHIGHMENFSIFGTPTLSSQEIFPHLLRLVAGQCPLLKEVQITMPLLKVLDLENNPNLEKLKGNLPSLELLNIKNNDKLELSNNTQFFLESNMKLKIYKGYSKLIYYDKFIREFMPEPRVLLIGYYNYPVFNHLKKILFMISDDQWPNAPTGANHYRFKYKDCLVNFWQLPEPSRYWPLVGIYMNRSSSILLFFNASDESEIEHESLPIFRGYYNEFYERAAFDETKIILFGIGTGTIGDLTKIYQFMKEAKVDHFACLYKCTELEEETCARDLIYAYVLGDDQRAEEILSTHSSLFYAEF